MRKFSLLLVLCGVGAAGAAIPEGPGFRIEPFKATETYAPVPKLAAADMTLKDGLMLKAGKPHFWIGQGGGPASGQQGPFGLWLTWLQHADGVTLDHGMETQVTEDASGKAVVTSKTQAGIVSWGRDAIRLGMLLDFFHNWNMNSSARRPLLKLLETHPDLEEIVHNYGHYLGCDVGYPEGVDIMVNRRAAIAEALKDEIGSFYLELCREPGPTPHNRRAYEGFRASAQKKYGTLAEACKTWRINYTSWDEVVPPHLDRQRWPFRGSVEVYLRRLMLKRDYPEIYWDWIDWMQRDLAKSVHDEIAALHRREPGVPFTIDVRGHTNRHDSYAALVPESIDPSEDLFALHNTTHAFVYGGKPADAASVTDATTFPFFGMGYFRRNAQGALANSEDIISIARAPNADKGEMAKNCLGQLVNTPWKFKMDPSGKGGKGAYLSVDYDDTAWDDIKVPGTWDTDPRFQGYGGIAWYRKTFTVPGAYKADHEDGSRIFKLIGQGVAQEGSVWLNGRKLGDVRGTKCWSQPYSFDVGPYLNYGGKNVLAWRVDGRGKGENGLRFESYILADDMLSKPEPFNERQFRQLVFSQLMEGVSCVWVWHWHDDAIRSYQPKLHAQAQTAAEIALPALRKRQGDIALLYPYADQPGVPAAHESTHRVYLDFVCAATFLGQKPDIVGEEAFCRDVTPAKYPVLLVPLSKRVTSATYAHFKDYVEKGGTAIVTDDALTRTAERYAATDIAAFAGRSAAAKKPVTVTRRGKGRIITFAGTPLMDELFTLLAPYLPAPRIAVRSHNAEERPLVDRLLAGTADRKVLFFNNWGGMDHPLTVTLPDEVKGWTLTPLVGYAKPVDAGHVNVLVPACDVAVAVLDRPGQPRVAPHAVSPRRMQKFDELKAMLARFVPADKADVLFMRNSYGRGGFNMGAELMPDYIRAAEQLGLKCAQSDPRKWTAETLRGRKLVVLTESNSNTFFKDCKNKDFWKIIEDYVHAGGALMIVSAQSDTQNVNGLALKTDRFGGSVVRGKPYAQVTKEGVWGDPFQFYGVAAAASPLCAEVEKVLVGITHTLRPTPGKQLRKQKKSGNKPVGAQSAIQVPADAIAEAGGSIVMSSEVDAGRVVLCADATMFQPFRIEHADNANLLINAMGWLVQKPVDATVRKVFREHLFLTENDLATINREEAQR